MATVRRQSSAQRRAATKYRRKYARLTKHRANGRLTTKVRSSKQRTAVAKLKSSGFYKRVSALRSSTDIPFSLSEGTAKIAPAFLELVLEAASEFDDAGEAREFAAHYATLDPWYTGSQIGLCALALEAYMCAEAEEVAELYVESILEPGDKTFLVVFQGQLSEQMWAKFEDEVDFADFDILVEAGDVDEEDGSVSDLTIVEVTPRGDQAEIDQMHVDDIPGEDAKPVIEVTVADYKAALKEGVAIETLKSIFRKEVADQVEARGTSLVWEDPNGVLWTLAGERWLPLEESITALEEAGIPPSTFGLGSVSSPGKIVNIKFDTQEAAEAALDDAKWSRLATKNKVSATVAGDNRYVAYKFKQQSDAMAFESAAKKHDKTVLISRSDKDLTEDLDESLYGFAFEKDLATQNAKDYSKEKKTTYYVVFDKDSKAKDPKRKYGFVKKGERMDGKGKVIATYTNGELVETVLDEAKAVASYFQDRLVSLTADLDPEDMRAWVKLLKKDPAHDYVIVPPAEAKEMRRALARGEEVLRPENSVAEELIDEAISDELLKKFAVPGKSLLLPDNNWWTIKSRDIDAGKITLSLSDYAIKDGATKAPDKSMSWSSFAGKAGSAWGIRINGKQYGPAQDQMKRAKLRAANGKRKAPGAPEVKEGVDEAEKQAYMKVSLGSAKNDEVDAVLKKAGLTTSGGRDAFITKVGPRAATETAAGAIKKLGAKASVILYADADESLAAYEDALDDIVSIEEGKDFPVGTVRSWGGRTFKKGPNGDWIEQQGGGGATKANPKQAQAKKDRAVGEKMSDKDVAAVIAKAAKDLEGEDAEALLSIADDVKKGNREAAFRYASKLDTFVREAIPPAAWVALGGKLVHEDGVEEAIGDGNSYVKVSFKTPTDRVAIQVILDKHDLFYEVDGKVIRTEDSNAKDVKAAVAELKKAGYEAQALRTTLEADTTAELLDLLAEAYDGVLGETDDEFVLRFESAEMAEAVRELLNLDGVVVEDYEPTTSPKYQTRQAANALTQKIRKPTLRVKKKHPGLATTRKLKLQVEAVIDGLLAAALDEATPDRAVAAVAVLDRIEEAGYRGYRHPDYKTKKEMKDKRDKHGRLITGGKPKPVRKGVHDSIEEGEGSTVLSVAKHALTLPKEEQVRYAGILGYAAVRAAKLSGIEIKTIPRGVMDAVTEMRKDKTSLALAEKLSRTVSGESAAAVVDLKTKGTDAAVLSSAFLVFDAFEGIDEEINEAKISTQNQEWGFYGTVKQNYGLSNNEAADAFNEIGQQLVKANKWDAHHVRRLLDSKVGRHLADELSFNGAVKDDFKSVGASLKATLAKSTNQSWLAGHYRGIVKTKEESDDYTNPQLDTVQEAHRIAGRLARTYGDQAHDAAAVMPLPECLKAALAVVMEGSRSPKA